MDLQDTRQALLSRLRKLWWRLRNRGAVDIVIHDGGGNTWHLIGTIISIEGPDAKSEDYKVATNALPEPDESIIGTDDGLKLKKKKK